MSPSKRSVAAVSALVAFGAILPICLAIVLVPSGFVRMQSVSTVDQAVDLFKRAGFDPRAAVQKGIGNMPPVFVASLPRDIDGLDDGELRKALFVSIVLPHVLQANDRIGAERERLLRIRDAVRAEKTLSNRDRRWLDSLAARYRTRPNEIDTLLRRVDIVPPQLAVAQAVQESGWGTSRFARTGNALFGQHAPVSEGNAIAAKKAEGVALRAFDTIYGSVRGYIHNLNTHPAYRRFRTMRAQMRANGGRIDGHALAAALSSYSEEGEVYVARLRSLMQIRAVAASRDAKLAVND